MDLAAFERLRALPCGTVLLVDEDAAGRVLTNLAEVAARSEVSGLTNVGDDASAAGDLSSPGASATDLEEARAARQYSCLVERWRAESIALEVRHDSEDGGWTAACRLSQQSDGLLRDAPVPFSPEFCLGARDALDLTFAPTVIDESEYHLGWRAEVARDSRPTVVRYYGPALLGVRLRDGARF